MSIEYIIKTLETMRYFGTASISETFSNGATENFTVHYQAENAYFVISSSLTENVIAFESAESAAEWIHEKTSQTIAQI